MNVFRTPILTAAFWAMLGLGTPLTALSQADIALLQADLDNVNKEISDLEDIKSKIEARSHALVVTPSGAAVFIEVERVESLFVMQLLEGGMTPDGAAQAARSVGDATRVYLDDIIVPDLEKAKRKRDRLEEDLRLARHGPDKTPVGSGINWPLSMDWTKVVATVRGTYRIDCRRKSADVPIAFTGSFRLELLGNGRVGATYESARFQWPADGTIDVTGLAGGEGSNQDGTWGWKTQFLREHNLLRMEPGSLTLRPATEDILCSQGYLFPSNL